MTYLLDTNIVTAILKRNERIILKLQEVRLHQQKLFISCLTYYEIKRGLLATNATRKMSVFNDFCRTVSILLLDSLEIIERASEIHADLKQKGRLIQDVDILIAATAIARHLILVSDDSDLLRVDSLTVENWLRL